MSALLTQAISSGRVVVRKGRKVSGELSIHFLDPGMEPIHIPGFEPVELTAIPGVDGVACQRSNLKKLHAMGLIEILL